MLCSFARFLFCKSSTVTKRLQRRLLKFRFVEIMSCRQLARPAPPPSEPLPGNSATLSKAELESGRHHRLLSCIAVVRSQAGQSKHGARQVCPGRSCGPFQRRRESGNDRCNNVNPRLINSWLRPLLVGNHHFWREHPPKNGTGL